MGYGNTGFTGNHNTGSLKHHDDDHQAEQTESEASSVMYDDAPSAAKSSDENEIYGTDGLSYATKKKIACVAIVVAMVIGIVVTAVLVSQARQSNSNTSPLSSGSSPVNPPTVGVAQPTTTARQEAFRSLLLSHSVSSNQDLSNPSTPQYRALDWLANKDQAKLSATDESVETIINRYVLAVLYFSSNGDDGWGFGFLSSESICTWHTGLREVGALCSTSTNELTSLILNLGGPVTGTFPTELGKLSTLTKLFIDNSEITGTIPTEFGDLTSLTTLDLSFNKFLRTTIPTELGKLSNLVDLGLGYNQLTGTIPTELGKLSNLTTLFLWSNELTGTIPTEFGKLSSLSEVRMESNRLNGTIPTDLLELSYTKTASADFPFNMEELMNLTFLAIQSNNLTDNLTATFCTGPQSKLRVRADCTSGGIDCSCCMCV